MVAWKDFYCYCRKDRKRSQCRNVQSNDKLISGIGAMSMIDV